jgi:hypothetical protein
VWYRAMTIPSHTAISVIATKHYAKTEAVAPSSDHHHRRHQSQADERPHNEEYQLFHSQNSPHHARKSPRQGTNERNATASPSTTPTSVVAIKSLTYSCLIVYADGYRLMETSRIRKGV